MARAIENHQRISTLLIFILITLLGCGKAGQNKVEESKGATLAKTHCVACHSFSSPELLDRNSWSAVLMDMETQMKKISYPIELEDWFEIQRYYLNNSPGMMPSNRNKNQIESQSIFRLDSSLIDESSIQASTVLFKYLPEKNSLLIGDIVGNISELQNLQISKRGNINDFPIDAEFNAKNNSLDILGMGTLMPSEQSVGRLLNLDKEGNTIVLIDSLARPIHFEKRDYNEDGEDEYLISCFGAIGNKKNTGRLSLFRKENDQYTEIILKEQAGATKSVSGDFNQDGKTDIIALFSQGNEVLYLFTNKGNLKFEESSLLRFGPLQGTNDFELRDINGDDHLDIILTNGDNGDKTPKFKPWHGVRVYINDGNFQFEESYFYPVNGASKVIVKDFDHDEDQDFAILSMYPDLANWPNEMLIYFENVGKNKFYPSFLEKEASGKWLLMESFDIDEDGKDDLITAANLPIPAILIPPRMQKKWNEEKTSLGVFLNKE